MVSFLGQFVLFCIDGDKNFTWPMLTSYKHLEVLSDVWKTAVRLSDNHRHLPNPVYANLQRVLSANPITPHIRTKQEQK